MRNSKEHIKILSTLSLAASDTREDTLISIIINSFFQKGEISKENICSSIKEIYDFEPYKDEVLTVFENLVEENRIVLKQDKNYVLSNDEINQFLEADIILKDKEKARFQNFKNFITDNLNQNIETTKIKFLWTTFVEYLYNNFYEYGDDALKRLHPFISNNIDFESDEDCLQLALNKLKDKELCEIFKSTIERFPDYASSDDLDFLNELAQKTLCFASLGINPKIAETNIDKALIDWILYLDTNVLYSLLDLHSHPENESCKALISLIRTNKEYLKIVLRYSELTRKELNSKRDDFQLLDEKLTDSSIKALLRSDKLDDFSKEFYEKLLNDRDSTLHPSKVIDFAPNTLLNHEIDIARNKIRIEKLGADYLDTRIQDYRRYIDEKNRIKQEFCEKNKIPYHEIYRSDKQIIHDITLREVLLDQRQSIYKTNEIVSFNSVKYFGVTLDSILLEYDKKQIKDYNDVRSFPVFFKPSFLLNKLVKVLPIKTDDYKKAFLKAVTSKGFNKDVQKSHDVLKIVNYLKKQGIDDEQVVFNLISKDLFLETYKKNKNKEDFNQGEFIESELNRTFKQKEEELKLTKQELTEKETKFKIQSNESEALKERKNVLEGELDLYKKALVKVQNDIEKLKKQSQKTPPQHRLDFETADAKAKHEADKAKMRQFLNDDIDEFKQKKFKSWQNKTWWNLFWVIPFTFIFLYIILFPNIIHNALIDSNSIRVVIGIFLLIFDGVFIFLIKSRYWDEGNKKNKFENIKPPKELIKRLKELESN